MAKAGRNRSREEVVFTWPVVVLLLGSVGVLVGSFAMKTPLQSDGYVDTGPLAYPDAATTDTPTKSWVVMSSVGLPDLPAGGPPPAQISDEAFPDSPASTHWAYENPLDQSLFGKWGSETNSKLPPLHSKVNP